MLNYIVAVNKDRRCIIIDYETDRKNCYPDIGYETDFDDWDTEVEEYMMDNDVFFDGEKAFREHGLYKVFGYDYTMNTPEGDSYYYMVEKIVKIQEFKY